MDYPLLKSLHVLGVVLFLGNVTVTALWKVMSERSRNPAVVAFGQRLVTLTDFAFTLPGALLILVTGHLMAGGHAAIFASTWLTWGWALFMLSGLLWVLVLIPVQVWQARLARVFAAGTAIPAQYWRLSRVWMVVGSAATILPLLNLYFMVAKPM